MQDVLNFMIQKYPVGSIWWGYWHCRFYPVCNAL